jgi:hypothetical protein
VNQTLNVLSGPMERLADRRLDRRYYGAWWWRHHSRNRRDNVNRVECQNRGVFVIENFPRGLVRQDRMRSEMPVDEERLVPVLLFFVDVLGRGDGKPPNRCHEDESDQPTIGH